MNCCDSSFTRHRKSWTPISVATRIVKQDSFPADPVAAIEAGCAEAERDFLEMVEKAADEAIKELLHEGIDEIP